MTTQGNLTRFAKATLAAATLSGFLLFAGTPALRADDDACRNRIVKADHRLHEAGGMRTHSAGTRTGIGTSTITTTGRT